LFICLCKSDFAPGRSEMTLFADEGKGMLGPTLLECNSALMAPAVKQHDLDQVLPAGLLL
jgi:hypothetical protein